MATHRIAYMRFAGKWAEFWFDNDSYVFRPTRSFDQCCKAYMFNELLVDGLEEYTLNFGCRGLKLTWPEGSDRPTLLTLPGGGIPKASN